MRNNVERCPYCGWFMRYEDSAEWGEAWVCARQAEHIIADPENWSVDVIALGDDAVDTDGDPISGLVGAHRLTPDQLRVALGITESTDPSPAQCTHEGGEWPGIDRCADCGQLLDPTDPYADMEALFQALQGVALIPFDPKEMKQ